MNPIRFLLLLVLTCGSAFAAPLKVVCWNLEWFPGKRPTASATEADVPMKEARDWNAFNPRVSAVPGGPFESPPSIKFSPRDSAIPAPSCWILRNP